MIFDLTIAGSSKQILSGSLEINLVANGRSSASFDLLSEDRSYRPALDAEVFIEEDGEVIFGGLVDKPDERGFGGGHHPGIRTSVNVVSFDAYTERRFINETIPAGTMKAALEVIVRYLTPYGVTLDGSQVNGPAIPELLCEFQRVDDVLNQVATLTADAGQPYHWTISHTKVLGMYQPSTTPAPFNLVGNDLDEVIGDITVDTSRSDDYANRIIVKITPVPVTNIVDTFTFGTDAYPYLLTHTLTSHRGGVIHNGVYESFTPWPGSKAYAFFSASANFSNGETVTIDGHVYTFVSTFLNADDTVKIAGTASDSVVNLSRAISGDPIGRGSDYGSGTVAHTTVDAYMLSGGGMKVAAKAVGTYANGISVTETAANALFFGEGAVPTSVLALGSDDAPAAWTWDEATNTISRTAGDPSSGDVTSITYDGLLEGIGVAQDAAAIAAHGIWERLIVLDVIPPTTTIQAIALAELAKRVQENKTVKYVTWEQGIVPGQQQTINVSSRNVNATAVITSVRIRDLVRRLERTVTAVVDSGQTNLSKSFQDDYKTWYGDKAGASAVSVGTGTPASSGPSAPDMSVQFNRAGVFGGDGAFTYDEDTNSVVCGGGASITAANHESCQVFGYNNHIADP